MRSEVVRNIIDEFFASDRFKLGRKEIKEMIKEKTTMRNVKTLYGVQKSLDKEREEKKNGEGDC